MTIHYTVRYAVTECPHCGSEIMRGHHRFGPKHVQCYSCKQVMETGLTPWADLPTGRKLLLALSELIVPSWNFPMKAFIGNLFAWYFVSGMLGLLGGALILVFAISYDSSSIFSITQGDSSWFNTAMTIDVIVAAIIGFLLIPVQRLIRIIIESNKYSKTGIPPVWKISRWLRK